MANSTRLKLFAITAPGLESIAANELRSLGVKPRREAGGVAFSGEVELLYASNLWLRTASRVVVRLARFHASTFYELERRAKRVPWSGFLPEKGSARVRVTCRKSRLYHSDAVAERVLAAIGRVAPGTLRVQADAKGDDDDSDYGAPGDGSSSGGHGSQLFIVRIVNDECEISADSSGDLLHRRGYRQEVAKAPLRETLAAAMVLSSGWSPNEPLLDPLCGSGTIPIEAALIARGLPPGAKRRFAFMDWPSFDANRWESVLGSAKRGARPPGAAIRGADRDAGAIAASRRNAERAGVATDIEFSAEALSASMAKLGAMGAGPGWVIANPPYGVRVGDPAGLRNLYARIGTELRANPGWRLGILTSDVSVARHAALPLGVSFNTRNGGIPVSFLVDQQPAKRKVRPSPVGVEGDAANG